MISIPPLRIAWTVVATALAAVIYEDRRANPIPIKSRGRGVGGGAPRSPTYLRARPNRRHASATRPASIRHS